MSSVVIRPGVAVAPMRPCGANSVTDFASGVRVMASGRRPPTSASINKSPALAVKEIVLSRVEEASPTTIGPVTVRTGACTEMEPSLVVAPSKTKLLVAETRFRLPVPVRLTLMRLNCEVNAASGDSSAVQLIRAAFTVATLLMIAVPVACCEGLPPPLKLTVGKVA